jgi:retron-type reverse transcriptase
VVQTAALLALEPIFEADFDEAAYGYRPKRSALVVVPRALLAHFHQSRSPQIRQMPRDRRLWQPQNFHQIAHAQFAGLNETQDLKADRVGKGPKHQMYLGFCRG